MSGVVPWVVWICCLVSGCATTNEIQVRLKSPRDLSLYTGMPPTPPLSFFGAPGPRAVLNPGAADARWTESTLFFHFGVAAHRNPDGSIQLRCPECAASAARSWTLFAPDAQHWIGEALQEELDPDDADPEGTIRLDTRELVLRWSAGESEHRRLEGIAQIPWSKVDAVREVSTPARWPGWVSVAAATLLEAAAAAAWARPSEASQAPYLLGAGGALDALGLFLLLRPAEVHQLPVPAATR